MLNVGPDGEGNIPEYSVKFLRETGKWLDKNGESIYGSTYGLIPAQPWGVSTSKPGRQFLHVINRPENGRLLVPDFKGQVTKVYALIDHKNLSWKKTGDDIWIDLPVADAAAANTVFVMEYSGKIADYDLNVPITVSNQYPENMVEATFAKLKGRAKIQSLTYSHYYGDWKHTICVTDLKDKSDEADFNIRVTEPGIYKIALEYSCSPESAKQEGSMKVNGQEFLFRTLRTSEFDKKAPLPFIKHVIATTTFSNAGEYKISVQPMQNGMELFKLKSVILEPVK
jgi:alpha-L-fucosidase